MRSASPGSPEWEKRSMSTPMVPMAPQTSAHIEKVDEEITFRYPPPLRNLPPTESDSGDNQAISYTANTMGRSLLDSHM